jgi:hypothetical protein
LRLRNAGSDSYIGQYVDVPLEKRNHQQHGRALTGAREAVFRKGLFCSQLHFMAQTLG